MKKIKNKGYVIFEVIVAIFIIVLSSSLLVFTVSNVKLHIKKREDIQLLYDVGEDIISEDLKRVKVKTYKKSELNSMEYKINYKNIDINLKKKLGKKVIYIKKTYVLLFSKYNLYEMNYILKMGDLKIKLNTKARFIIEN